jgi:hypothetical protein
MLRTGLSVFASAGALLAGFATAPSAEAQEWRWSVTPYVWFAGVEQKAAVNSTLPTVGIDMDFGDIVDEAQFVLMGKFEASNGRLHFIGELSYADIGSAAVIESANFPNLTAASLGAETFLGTAAVGYRLLDTGSYWIDGIAGVRYTGTKTDLSFNLAGGGVLNGGEDENWLDGFVGARGAVKLDSRWSLLGYADVGGGGSNYTWQAYAGVDYELNPNTHLFGGYRAYKDEYENDDGYLYSVLQQGPIVGATFWF